MFEKVNPAHPDKIADRIAGALVDLAYEQEYNPRIAVEVLIGHGVCHIIAETSVALPMAEVGELVSRIAGANIFVAGTSSVFVGNMEENIAKLRDAIKV